ncbi:hypothetical protein ACRALDRAFT_1091026 [Sodiomyces alcalophilus JCM 7366]|uniref:uncharacterized protein n=1 Tax=Sodiomyces alcalophilus JCM 7366 TaxID=591952 RepID=UPI0039B5D412
MSLTTNDLINSPPKPISATLSMGSLCRLYKQIHENIMGVQGNDKGSREVAMMQQTRVFAAVKREGLASSRDRDDRVRTQREPKIEICRVSQRQTNHSRRDLMQHAQAICTSQNHPTWRPPIRVEEACRERDNDFGRQKCLVLSNMPNALGIKNVYLEFAKGRRRGTAPSEFSQRTCCITCGWGTSKRSDQLTLRKRELGNLTTDD